ncbi:60S acidic ribosomal protein P2-3 [Capsicum annuum]|uniref:60S acidic ribosomal protein P2-3 n=1 Tax=Capsicum annuum TaxID=4072 RepID=A0A2G2Z109_CAPAN|nr:60S acidic ribosomal protein P2-3 [Capsicum annuum]KAF3617968.1 60S acidic ribosomal protein P2-3 [Capsicum annuum]PHT75555.1 60S acidic ribosomal protein P2-3 [Capsicum annuum]
MKVIAAYLLAQLGGNSSPSSDDLKKILNSVGAEIDDVKIELLLSQVKGKDINELIAAGKEKLASTSCLSFGCVANNASVVVDGGQVIVVEEKKAEKKVEKEEESDEEDFNFSLFD